MSSINYQSIISNGCEINAVTSLLPEHDLIQLSFTYYFREQQHIFNQKYFARFPFSRLLKEINLILDPSSNPGEFSQLKLLRSPELKEDKKLLEHLKNLHQNNPIYHKVGQNVIQPFNPTFFIFHSQPWSLKNNNNLRTRTFRRKKKRPKISTLKR